MENGSIILRPVYSEISKDYFFTGYGIEPHEDSVGGVIVKTAPLAIGKRFSLLGISASDELLENKIIDQTDYLDPNISLKNVYLRVGKKVIVFEMTGCPTANFTYAIEGNYRVLKLQLKDKFIIERYQFFDNPIDGLKDKSPFLQCNVSLTGDVNLETGETQILVDSFKVNQTLYNLGVPYGVDKDVTAEILGYDLLAARVSASVVNQPITPTDTKILENLSSIEHYATALEGTLNSWVNAGLIPIEMVPQIKNHLILKWDAE